MLINTGSAVTLVREKVWNQASVHKQVSTPDSPVVAANGVELDVLGKTSVLLEVGGLRAEFPVLIAKNLTQECILGADFLCHHKCVVDLQRQVLLAGEEPVQLDSPTLQQKPSCDIPRIDYHTCFLRDSVAGASCW